MRPDRFFVAPGGSITSKVYDVNGNIVNEYTVTNDTATGIDGTRIVYVPAVIGVEVVTYINQFAGTGTLAIRVTDARIIDGLRDSFAHYDAADIGRALLAQMESFRVIATETAQLLGYLYPHDADSYCSAWVKETLKN